LIIKFGGYFCSRQLSNKMNRIIAKFFLLVQVLNLGGYLLLHWCAVQHTDDLFDARVEQGKYNQNELVEVAIPVEMPGMHDWNSYIPVFGCVQFGENAYNYVQIKVTSNMLYLKCVPNYETTKLYTQNVIHAEAIKDIPVPKKDHVPYPHVLFTHAFNVSIQRFAVHVPSTETAKPISDYQPPLIERQVDIPKQPPKHTC
jgi:hypothetical protein